MSKKKKKQSKKKKTADLPQAEKSPFWGLSVAIGMVLLAILLLLGGFGTGGPLPVNLFHAMYWVFGWAAYLTPFAFLYWGIFKFNAEDRRIPLGNRFSMF